MVRRHGTRHLTSDRHDSGQGEALPQLFHLSAHRARVGAVAFEHLDSHRTPLGGYTTSRRRSGVCGSCRPVPGIAVFGQGTRMAFEVTGREVVEDHRPFRKVRQPLLDGIVTFHQPIHGRVEFVFIGILHPQFLSKTARQVVPLQTSGSGQFGGRAQNACGNQPGPYDGRRRPVHGGPRYRPAAGWREGR
jgi:hypothetical protein